MSSKPSAQPPIENRRPVSSRQVTLFHRIARRLVKMGLHPNHVSVASSIFAIFAAISIVLAPSLASPVGTTLLLIGGLIGIQLRLLCNLFDGLMAIEGGLKTPTGEIYNDLPDRVSDVVILIAAGYSASLTFSWAPDLSWIAATLALTTAYTRVLGASMLAPHFFSGPMAKQHRMFAMNLACLGSLVEFHAFKTWGYSFVAVLSIIAIGSLLTCINRLRQISQSVNSLRSK